MSRSESRTPCRRSSSRKGWSSIFSAFISVRRPASDDWDFPDRVVLFQRNIENISPDRETLLAEIRDTLLHEVGHHFGMDEDTLREIEDGDEP